MWTVELDVSADGDGTRDDLRALLLVAYGELRQDTAVRNPRMWATLASNDVTFKGIIPVSDREEACRSFSASVRASLHAAGAHTPGWAEKVEQLLAALPMSRLVAEPIAA